MASRTLLTMLVTNIVSCAVIAEPAKAQFIKKYAVLVGVNEYPEVLGDLRCAVNDVDRLEQQLIKIGYEGIQVLKTGGKVKPTHANIRDAIENLFRFKMDESDHVLIAFSGHGVHYDGHPCFCPSDVRINRDPRPDEEGLDVKRLISLKWVLEDRLPNLKAGVKVMLCDACRNTLNDAGSIRAKGAEPEIDTKRIDSNKAKGVAGLFSCSKDQRAYENSELNHSWFFHYVIKGLEGSADVGPRDGKLDIAELSTYVQKEVSAALTSQDRIQTPELVLTANTNIPLAVFQDRLVSWTPKTLGWEETQWEHSDTVTQIERFGGVNRFYDEITRNIVEPGSERILKLTFRVIPDSRAPFYVTKDKVSRELFMCFVDQHPDKADVGSPWLNQNAEKDLKGSWPAFNVTYGEASAFADWLSGDLPTSHQWDYAAGYDDWINSGMVPADAGPFQVPGLDIGVGLKQPLPVGSSPGDFSKYLIRDMAGNGKEWTSSSIGGDQLLRGQRYDASLPLTFQDIASSGPGILAPRQRSNYVGFRVVLNPR